MPSRLENLEHFVRAWSEEDWAAAIAAVDQDRPDAWPRLALLLAWLITDMQDLARGLVPDD